MTLNTHNALGEPISKYGGVSKEALAKLQLRSRRIDFSLQTLCDLSKRREVRVYLGDPYEFATQNAAAVTYVPSPSFKKFKKLDALYSYLWLTDSQEGSVRSFISWNKKL